MEQKKSFNWRSALSTLITVVVLYLAGALTAILTGTRGQDLWIIVWLTCLLSLVLMALGSFFGGKIYMAGKNKMKVAETKDYMLSKKGKADADPAVIAKRLRRVQGLIWIFMLTDLILLVGMVFSSGGFGGNYVGTMFIDLWIFCGIYNCLFAMSGKNDFSRYATRDEFPELYRLAESAAETVGVKGKLHIDILPDCNAGILRMGKDISLQVGSQLLSVLRPEELFQILLHEFAHLANEGVVTRFGDCFAFRFIKAGGNDWGDEAVAFMLELPTVVAAFEYATCQMACSEYSERLADAMILEKGDPAVASAALCKTAMGTLFDRELGDFIPESFYATEEVRPDINSVICTAFRRAIDERKDFWLTLLNEKELPRLMGSHPIFRQRHEALGAPDFTLTMPEEGTAYWQDTMRAIKRIDRQTVENLKETYAERRRENYLEPLELVERFEASDGSLSAPEIPPLIAAYRNLGRYDTLEKLCDRLLADDQLSEHETVAALFWKGGYLLSCYDRAGLEMIYRAMEINEGYIEGGLDQIGDFCHWMGLEEEMNIYRAKSIELMQEKRDGYDMAGTLSASDKLIREDFDGDGRLTEMLDYMVEAGEGKLLEIFLVRKVISDDFFTSAFVLRYDYGLTQDEMDEIYVKVYHYLDNYPLDWQFSLFVYDRRIEKAVKKVKDSCVYKRNE